MKWNNIILWQILLILNHIYLNIRYLLKDTLPASLRNLAINAPLSAMKMRGHLAGDQSLYAMNAIILSLGPYIMLIMFVHKALNYRKI